jgi:hypothetical protein
LKERSFFLRLAAAAWIWAGLLPLLLLPLLLVGAANPTSAAAVCGEDSPAAVDLRKTAAHF